MISRIWHGYTTLEKAPAYEAIFKEEVVNIIQEKAINGFIDIQLLKRPKQHEMEFMTIIRFENLAAVRAFAGEDYETAFVPEKVREILIKFDLEVAHYETVE